MPRLPTRILLCLSSYSPLLMLVGVRAYRDFPLVARVCWVAAGLSVLLLTGFFAMHSRRAPTQVDIAEVQQRDGDVMGYVITYLVPFVGFGYRDANGQIDMFNMISVGVLFAVIVVIYVNANLIFINPVLGLFGFRVYEVELARTGAKKALLTRRISIGRNRSLHVIELGPFFLWEPGS